MKNASRLLIASLASFASIGTAAAQDTPDGDGAATEPAPDGMAPDGMAPDPNAAMPDPNATPDMAPPPAAGVVIGKGKVWITGPTVNVSLSTDAVAKPINLAPAIYYGVNEKLTVGITHSGGTTSLTPRPAVLSFSIPATPLTPAITAAAGSGICVTGEDSGCPDAYRGIGLDAMFGLAAGKFSVAAHGGLDTVTFDPFTVALRVGALGNYMASDKLSIVFDPRISIGITERDGGNKESLDIPVWIWYHVNPKLGAFVSTGINGPLDGFGDAFSVPVGLGAMYKVNEKLGAGANFFFTNLAGKNGGADGRSLGIVVDYAL